MTAIVSVLTPEGFVIGADGRETERDMTLISDTVQKIFPAEAVNIKAVYGWAGAVRMSHPYARFDFREFSRAAEEWLRGHSFSSLRSYAEQFAQLVYDSFELWASANQPRIGEMESPLVSLFMAGFVGNSAETLAIDFPYSNGKLLKPVVRESADLPISFNRFWGSETVFETMRAEGYMSSPTTVAQGVQLVTSYLETCVANNQTLDDCRNIGGHIHVARLTPSGSHWLIAPEGAK